VNLNVKFSCNFVLNPEEAMIVRRIRDSLRNILQKRRICARPASAPGIPFFAKDIDPKAASPALAACKAARITVKTPFGCLHP
jgi:hypothetical protein